MARERLGFPLKGATDRTSFEDTPEGFAPVNYLLNVRPRDVFEGRERGGQRPGLVGLATASGEAWGKVGEGPIQLIQSIERPARIEGYEIGACRDAFVNFDSRDGATQLAGNLYVAKGKTTTRPGVIRNADIGDALTFSGRGSPPSRLYVESAAFYGENALFGALNELPGNESGSTSEHFLFKTYFAAGRPGGGFGSPQWEAISQTGLPLDGATPVQPYPCDAVCAFAPGMGYEGDNLNGVGFAALSNPLSVNGERDWAYLAAFDLTASSAHLITSVNPRFAEQGPGGAPAKPGAQEIRALRPVVQNGRAYVYFTYRANPMVHSKIGRFDVTGFTTASGTFSHDGLSGAVQIDGSGLDETAINYPRGATPGDVCVAPNGAVYFTRSSTGYGRVGTALEIDPLNPSRVPVTVVKINPAGTAFEWEIGWRATGAPDLAGLGVREPEVTCCDCDSDGVYVGSHDGWIAKLDQQDGRVRWQARTASGNRITGCRIDPKDGNPIFSGGSNVPGEGQTGFAFAFKVDRTNGRQMWNLKAPGETAIGRCLDVHPTSDLFVIGKYSK